jgi:hypothetical protein
MPVDSIRVICSIIRDTSEMAEGDRYRVVYALVANDTLKIDISRDRIRTITVERPTYVTVDSIRVGMPVSEFLKRWQPEVVVGEGKMFMLDDRNLPGLSFGLTQEAYHRAPTINKSNLSTLPRSTHIDLILVRGR